MLERNYQHTVDLGRETLKLIKIKNSFKDNFNIFRTLNLERKEVELHSYILYELLNIKGDHNQKSTFLKIFIQVILGTSKFDSSNCEVIRELSTDKYGRIDFVINNLIWEGKKTTLLIEMKIDAEDQKDQLNRYDKYGKTLNHDYLLFYLTLDGKDASSVSASKSLEYKRISFKNHVKDFISTCIEKSSMLPTIRETLKQYKTTINNLCFDLEEEDKMEIREFLLKSDNLKVIEELSKAIPEAKLKIEKEFWNDLEKEIEPIVKENNFEIDSISIDRSSKWAESGIKLIFEDNIFNNFKMIFGIFNTNGDRDIYFRISLEDNSKNYISLKDIESEFLEKLKGIGITQLNYNKTYGWKFLDLDYNSNTLNKFLDEIEKTKIINNLVTELGISLEYIYKNGALKNFLKENIIKEK